MKKLSAFTRITLPLLLTLSSGAMAAEVAAQSSTISSETLAQQQDSFIVQQQKAGFSAAQTRAFLADAKLNQDVLNAISRPWEAKPWYQYYPLFLTEKRLQAGLDFWRAHEQTIKRAAWTYQVDPQIIVAIIGIETFYGQFMGNYPVLDALYTLGFYYPPRADFFRSELGQLQQLITEEHLPLSELKGSYAGAMGYGQFISSSYRHYAVDFNGDGQRDLINNIDDAIGSVANYFHQHGWQYHQPVALELKAQAPIDTTFLWDTKPLHFTAADILNPELSLKRSGDLDISQPAMLIELEQLSSTEYWLGLNNFYVITRYNRSPLYAMAVYQFSEQLKKAHDVH